MEKMISGPFAEILRGSRDRFNTRFAIGKAAFPRLDARAFSAFLAEIVAPIVEKVHTEVPGRAPVSAEHLFEFSLQMMGRGFFGETPKEPFVQEWWKRLMLGLPRFLAEDPGRFCGSMFNAAFQISPLPGEKSEAFVDQLLQVGRKDPGFELFLDAGRILAWKAGLTGLRETALGLIDRLPTDLLKSVLEIPDPESVDLEILKNNLRLFPWLKPARALNVNPDLEIAAVGRVGAFKGLSGPFSTPPEVFPSGGKIIASDRNAWYRLDADAFGHTFSSCGSEAPPIDQMQSPAFSFRAGKITCGALNAVFKEFSKPSSFAITDSTLAITIPQSHAIFLFGLAGKAP